MFLYDALMQILRSLSPPFASTFLRLTSLLVWAVVAYSAVVFGLQWGAGAPVDAVVAGTEQKQGGALHLRHRLVAPRIAVAGLEAAVKHIGLAVAAQHAVH